MSSSGPNDGSLSGPPPALPPSSLRASGSSATLHDLLNFPSPNYDAPPPRPPPHAGSYGQPSPSMSFYTPYQPAQHGPPHGYDPHQHGGYAQQQAVASSSTGAYHGSTAGYSGSLGGSYEHIRPAEQRMRRDSIPSSLASADDGPADQQPSASQTPAPHQQPRPAQVVDVPEEVIAGLAGRQLTEKKRKWRAKAGVQGPGKSWRKGLKDADRPPPAAALPPAPEPMYIPAVEEPREGHYLEPDWQSPLPPKKRKELTEKNRSRFVASAPAIKYNQAWITAEPLLNKGEAKTAPVRRWRIGNRLVRSITGHQWLSKGGWVGEQESALATLIQEQKIAAAQAAAAAMPQSSLATQTTSASGTPMPEGPAYLAPPGTSAGTLSQSPAPQRSSNSGPGGMGIGMPHEKHRLYALTREAENAAQSAGPSSREGSVLSVGSDGTGL